jgi:hypothetical protein
VKVRTLKAHTVDRTSKRVGDEYELAAGAAMRAIANGLVEPAAEPKTAAKKAEKVDKAK